MVADASMTNVATDELVVMISSILHRNGTDMEITTLIATVYSADPNARALMKTAGGAKRWLDQHPSAFQLFRPQPDEQPLVWSVRLMAPVHKVASVSEVEAAVRAISLLAWHLDSVYSGADGTPTSFTPACGGRRRKTASGRTMYPRMDAVAIVLVESADGQRCLLGRQASYPPGMYTCISGFVEHGESAENAAMRETHEETAVVCTPGSAQLVASQPWPCGRGNHCELMLGVFARAVAGGETIDCGAGGALMAGGAQGVAELQDARWFSREEARTMLERSVKKSWAAGELLVPPPLAIAHALISRWVSGTVPGK
jgi:NAD+ diphosphatase